MRLYLSSRSPWNSTYSTEDGHLLYKVECSYRVSGRRASFYHALPDLRLPTSERQLWEERHYLETHASWSEHPEEDGQGSGISTDDLITERRRSVFESDHESQPPSPLHPDDHPFFEKEHWAHYADIDFHTPPLTHFKIGGDEFAAKEYFKKVSRASRDRLFTAWDGKRYLWEMGNFHLKLYHLGEGDTGKASTNSERELIAQYYPSRWDSQKHRAIPPLLEISASGESLADLILVTFIYIERVRESEGPGTSTTQGPPRSSTVVHITAGGGAA